MVTKLSVVSSFDKVKMPPKKKARVDRDPDAVDLSWTDDEVVKLPYDNNLRFLRNIAGHIIKFIA